jgi:hypothetical protein
MGLAHDTTWCAGNEAGIRDWNEASARRRRPRCEVLDQDLDLLHGVDQAVGVPHARHEIPLIAPLVMAIQKTAFMKGDARIRGTRAREHRR